MAITLVEQNETDRDDREPEQSELPDASYLEDRFPEGLKVTRVVAGFTAVVSFIYLFMSIRPLWHTDLWGHLAYGRHIWNSGSLPSFEPLMPLANGMAFIDTAWLSQLVGYGAYSAYGIAALKFLYAVSITLTVSLLLWRFYQRSQNVVLSLMGLTMFLWVDWQQLLIVRPQLAGLLCFVSLLVLLTGRRWSRINWYLVPAMFALWANMHGSFPVGLMLLGCFCLGRAIDVFRKTGKILTVVYDRKVRRYFMLTELAAVAALLTPYGLATYVEAFSVVGHENLADLMEWQAMQLRMSQGQAAAITALGLMFAYRMSPRRISAVEILLLVGFGVMALWTSRMILWWAPLAAWYFVLHTSAARKHARRNQPVVEPSYPDGKWTIVTVALVWIAFGLSPIFSAVFHGNQPNFDKSVSQFTPIAAVEYLKKNPPKGQVFNTYEWGDYLLWAGPENIQTFVASHAHLVPQEVWQDYMRISNGNTGWQDRLDRYGVNTVVIDHRYRGKLIRGMKLDAKWKLGFEDKRAAVFIRKKQI